MNFKINLLDKIGIILLNSLPKIGLLLAVISVFAPRPVLADEWEDLFQELNKPGAKNSASSGSSASPSSAQATPRKNVASSPEPSMEEDLPAKEVVKPMIEEAPAVATPSPAPQVAAASRVQPQLTPEVKALIEEDTPAPAMPIPSRNTQLKPLTQSEVAAGSLVNLNDSRALRQIDDLERRLQDVEKENRLLVEKVRNLTRTVDDLKRRR